VNRPSNNPLRRELARSQVAAPHPDANLLTAFAEGTLTAREREGVLEHLSLCAECREVVNLAAGAAEDAAIPAPRIQPAAARPGIRRWLPWAATAAGVVVVCAAVLQHESSRTPAGELAKTSEPVQTQMSTKTSDEASREATEATNRMPSASTDKGTANAIMQPAIPPAEADGKLKADAVAKKEAPKTALASKIEMSGASGGAIVGGLTQRQEQQIEAKNAKDLSAQNRNFSGLQQAPAANSNNQAADANAYAANSNQAQFDSMRRDQAPASFGANQANSNQNVSAARAKSPLQRSTETVEVQSAASQVQVDTPVAEATPAPAMKQALIARKAARPHWRINDTGQLEVSYGDGTWSRVLANESAKFTIVSVIGGDVWAGGENARLYHSADNGATWTPIPLPPKNGTAQTVVGIQFQTPQTGSVECDDGTRWISTDGGKTWK